MAASANFKVNECEVIISTFEEMGLREELRQDILYYGFSQPLAMQQKMILPIVAGRDVILEAKSGTGKTAGISIATLQSLNPSVTEPQVLVLTPTRQLAAKFECMADSLGASMNVRCHAFVGVIDIEVDVQLLGIGRQQVCGTPGRVLDMIRRGVLRTKSIRTLIVDDADKMMKRGFREQILDIFRHLTPAVQIVLSTTRMTDSVKEMSSILMTNPVRISITREKKSLVGIKQVFIPVEREGSKFPTLCELYGPEAEEQAVIFCNTRNKVVWLADKLKKANYSVGSLHGEMPSEEREEVLGEFCLGIRRVLITTDVKLASIRGQRELVVFNYDFPESCAQFSRRLGLSSCQRASVSLMRTEDLKSLQEIEESYYFGFINNLYLNKVIVHT